MATTSPYSSTIPGAQGYQGYTATYSPGGTQPATPTGGSPTAAPSTSPTTTTSTATSGGSTEGARTASDQTATPQSTSNTSIAGNAAIATASTQTPTQYSLQDAQTRLNQWSQAQYGQQLSDPAQWQQLASMIGYTGGNVTQQQFEQAQNLLQQYAPQLGWQPVQQQQQAASPAQAGIDQFQQWAQQTFGRQATAAELQQIAAQIGYTGGALTPQQLQAAQQVALQMAGGTPAASPANPTNPTQPAQPGPLTATNGTNARMNIDPLQSFTTQNAVAIVQQHAQQWFGRPLTEAEMNQIIQVVGFTGGGSVNGRTVNMALDLLQLWGNTGVNAGNNTPNIPEFENPIDPGLDNEYQAYLRNLLANPESLSPAAIEAMKARQREETLSYLEQARQQGAQQAARRGVLPGGVQAATDRRLLETGASQMTLGNREVDIEAARTNFNDRLRTSSAVNEGLGGIHGRGLSAHQAALQAALAREGLRLDRDRLSQGNWQFNQGYGLSYLQMLNDLIMGRANYGLNLAGMQQNQQNQMFNWLGSALGGR